MLQLECDSEQLRLPWKCVCELLSLLECHIICSGPSQRLVLELCFCWSRWRVQVLGLQTLRLAD